MAEEPNSILTAVCPASTVKANPATAARIAVKQNSKLTHSYSRAGAADKPQPVTKTRRISQAPSQTLRNCMILKFS
jgi:hypothetical protein